MFSFICRSWSRRTGHGLGLGTAGLDYKTASIPYLRSLLISREDEGLVI